jgi:RNA polymerase sigma-70 factor (ECF subfamily)
MTRNKGFTRDGNHKEHNGLPRLANADAPASRGLPLARDEERRLLREAREGDPAALRRLLERVSPPIYRFGRGFCGDAEDAKDVMQEVLISLVRSLPSIRGDSSLTTWAYTVARRACARQRRREKEHGLREPEAVLERMPAPDETSPDPSRQVEKHEVESAVRDAILLLPPSHREAIILRDLEGMSARDAARILHVSERALKSRLHRARLAVRDALARNLGEASPGVPGSCPDAGRLLSRYLEGELNASSCASMEAHLHTCRSCGRACRALKRSLTLCRRYGSRPISAAARESLRSAIRGVIAESRSRVPSSRS